MVSPCVERNVAVSVSLHGGVYALRLEWSVRANAGENVAAVRVAVAQVSSQPQGRSSACEFAWSGRRYLLPAAYRLPVEGAAASVWFVQHGASVLSRVEQAARLSAFLEEMPANLRQATRHRLAVAKFGRGANQGAAGWGKKPGKTQRIAASSASNARSSLTPAASRWALPSTAPTVTTPNCCGPHCNRCRCDVPHPLGRASNICVWTKATLASLRKRSLVASVTCPTSPPRGKTRGFAAPDNVPAVGSWKEAIRGPTAPAACWCGGKRKPTIIWRSSICNSPTSP